MGIRRLRPDFQAGGKSGKLVFGVYPGPPSYRKTETVPELTLTAIYAQKPGTPKDREPIDWNLLTDLPVSSRAEAGQTCQTEALSPLANDLTRGVQMGSDDVIR